MTEATAVGSADLKQIWLGANHCSRRGVRLKLLSEPERMQILESAAKELGPDGTNAELRIREGIDGVCAMVVAVTEKGGFASAVALRAPDVAWKKVTLEELTHGRTKYFNAKDMSALINVFRAYHDVTQDEVDNIMGEALDVTED